MAIITNPGSSRLVVGDVTFEPNDSVTITNVTDEMVAAVEAGTLTSDTDLTPLTGLAVLTNNISDITDSSGGTAATVTDGAATVATVSDVATAANAIALLLEEVERQRVINDALITRINLVATTALDTRTMVNNLVPSDY